MNHTNKIRSILLCTGIWALAALGLRVYTDLILEKSGGLLPLGSPLTALTVLLSLLGMGALAVLCLGLDRRPGTESSLEGNSLRTGLRLLAALGLFCSCGLQLLHSTNLDHARRVYELLGLPTAVLMAVSTCYGRRLGKAGFWMRLLCVLWISSGLILRFRSWSKDPLLIHLTPSLLAFLCDMMVMMLLSGYPLGAGHRRSIVVFGFGAGVFTLMVLVDYLTGLKAGFAELLGYLSLCLWSVSQAAAVLWARDAEVPEVPAQGDPRS